MLQWIDDSLVYAVTWADFLKTFDTFCCLVKEKRLRFNVEKCCLHRREVNWCGRHLSSNGWRFDEVYAEKIKAISELTTLGELEDVIYSSQWLGATVLKLSFFKQSFTELVLKLKREKRNSLRDDEERNSKQRKNIILGTSWTKGLQNLHERFREVTEFASKLNLQNFEESVNIMLITDASDNYWSAILGQKVSGEDENDLTTLKFRPMFHASQHQGSLKGSSLMLGMPCNKAAKLKRGIVTSVDQEEDFCKAVIKRLPLMFRKGGAKVAMRMKG